MSASIKSIYQLFKSSPRPLAAFIGSGLSVPEPSSLPLNKEVIVSLLSLDWVKGEEFFPIPESQIENSNLCKIRFEHLLSTFNGWGKHDMGILLRQFADAPPNWYHNIISELCKEKKIDCIVTTNFDSCLEKALSEQGVAYNVIVNEDDEYSDDRSITNVFKIHGTIDRKGASYLARGLGATLESIAIGLQAWKHDLLLRLLNQYTLVLLGYSGSDSYDINPLLYEMSNQHLCWIAHKSNDNDEYLSSEVSSMLAQSLYSNPIHIDTAEFLGGSPLPRRKSKFRFIPTYNLDNLWHPSVFIGAVLQSIDDYKNAQHYYEEVLDKSTWKRYWQVEQLDLLRANAVTLYELGKYKAAEFFLFTAAAVLLDYNNRMKSDGSTPEELKSKIFLDHFLLINEEQSLVYTALGRNEEAIESIESAFKALEGLQKIGHDASTQLAVQSRLLLNRSNIKLKILQEQADIDLGEYLIVLEDVKSACKMKRKIGDATGLILCLAMLGHIYTILSEGQSATSMFLEMFGEMQKLKTPFGKRVATDAMRFLGTLIYFNVSGDKAEKIHRYLDHKSDTKTKFENNILSIVIHEAHKDGNQVLQCVLQDELIRRDSEQLREELND